MIVVCGSQCTEYPLPCPRRSLLSSLSYPQLVRWSIKGRERKIWKNCHWFKREVVSAVSWLTQVEVLWFNIEPVMILMMAIQWRMVNWLDCCCAWGLAMVKWKRENNGEVNERVGQMIKRSEEERKGEGANKIMMKNAWQMWSLDITDHIPSTIHHGIIGTRMTHIGTGNQALERPFWLLLLCSLHLPSQSVSKGSAKLQSLPFFLIHLFFLAFFFAFPFPFATTCKHLAIPGQFTLQWSWTMVPCGQWSKSIVLGGVVKDRKRAWTNNRYQSVVIQVAHCGQSHATQ